MKHWILDDEHNLVEVDLETWARWFEDIENRRVGWTEVGDVKVSTVCLGIDHRFGEGPPLLFETMIFGGPHDQYQERYSTWDEAQQGHLDAVVLAQER